MAWQDTVNASFTIGIFLVALIGLQRGAFSYIPLIGKYFPSPPLDAFDSDSEEFKLLRRGVECVEEIRDLFKERVNGPEMQNLVEEVRDHVKVHADSLNEIKQISNRVATLLEAGVLGPKERPYLKEVVAHLKAGLDSFEEYNRFEEYSRRGYKLRWRRELMLLRRLPGPSL